MNYCYKCCKPFDDIDVKKHYEHIIQNAIGGRLTSNNILCEKCGCELGEKIDAPFTSIFENICKMINITKDHGNDQKRIIHFSSSNNIYEYDCGKKELYPRKPIEIRSDNKLHIFCHTKLKKELENKYNDKDIIFHHNILTCPQEIKCFLNLKNIFLPFNLDSDTFKKGLSKIAVEFALHSGIKIDNLNNILLRKDDKNYFVDKPIIFPYSRLSKLSLTIEKFKQYNTTDYPNHILILFNIKINNKNCLFLFIELFSTFQFYILLSDNFPYDNYLETYAQKIVKQDSSSILIESKDLSPKNFDILKKQYNFTEEELKKIDGLYKQKIFDREALERQENILINIINSKIEESRYKVNIRDYLSTLFDPIAYIAYFWTEKKKLLDIKNIDQWGKRLFYTQNPINYYISSEAIQESLNNIKNGITQRYTFTIFNNFINHIFPISEGLF